MNGDGGSFNGDHPTDDPGSPPSSGGYAPEEKKKDAKLSILPIAVVILFLIFIALCAYVR